MTPPTEDPFRATLLVLFLALAVWWTRAFVKSGLDRESFFNPREGLVLAIVFRLLLAAGIGGILVYAIDPDSMRWSSAPLPSALRWCGAPLAVAGLLFFDAARRALGRDFSPSPRIKPGGVLVTGGPYRRIRHPMYVAFLLCWAGYGLLSANWWIGGTGLAAELMIALLRTPREEALLRAAFGPAYDTYARRTPRFVPRLRG